METRTGICVVLYYPEKFRLTELREELQIMQSRIVIVDNTPEIDHSRIFEMFEKMKYIPLGKNLGIAAAQNIGVNYLLKDKNINSILLLDQDSKFTFLQFEKLLKSFNTLKNQKLKIGAVGPSAINGYDNSEYKGRIVKGNYKLPRIREHKEIISSGSLIPKEAFLDVGNFEEQLFIDGVDHEWCWRAGAKGYKFYVCETSKLIHFLGEGDKKLFGIRFRTPKPIRTYYQYRNFLRLVFRGYVPLYWKLSNTIKYLIKIPIYIFFFKERKKFARYISEGIYDGIFRKNYSSIDG